MRLLKIPILLLVISPFFFSSCEPTYDELVAAQYELLFNKEWKQVSESCFENQFQFDFMMTDNSEIFVQETLLQNGSNGNQTLVTDSYSNYWEINNFEGDGFFTIYFRTRENHAYQLMSVTADKLVLIENDCIFEFEN